jgi:hypothetical protein
MENELCRIGLNEAPCCPASGISAPLLQAAGYQNGIASKPTRLRSSSYGAVTSPFIPVASYRVFWRRRIKARPGQEKSAFRCAIGITCLWGLQAFEKACNLLILLEAATGFEPVNNGFADRCLSLLAMPPVRFIFGAGNGT